MLTAKIGLVYWPGLYYSNIISNSIRRRVKRQFFRARVGKYDGKEAGQEMSASGSAGVGSRFNKQDRLR